MQLCEMDMPVNGEISKNEISKNEISKNEISKIEKLNAEDNWKCESCKNINFAYRTRCNRCELGKGEVPVIKRFGDEVRQYLIGICDEETGSEENWECKHCNNLNPTDKTTCIRCAKDKKESLKRKHGLAIGNLVSEKSEGFFAPDDWQCNCGNINSLARVKCNLCDLGRKHGQPIGEMAAKKSRGLFSPEDWLCSCTNVNYVTKTKCNRCELERSNGIVKRKHGQELGEFLASRSRGLFIPEDWQCNCGSINFTSAKECRRCARAKTDKPVDVNRIHGYEIGEEAAIKSGGRFHAVDWQCKCGNINFAIRTKCNVCEIDRKHGQEIGEDLASKSHGLFSAEDWHCNCGNINYARRKKCKLCDLDRFEETVKGGHGHGIGEVLARHAKGPFSADDWQCQCGNINFSRRTKCNRCEADRKLNEMETDAPMLIVPQKSMFSAEDWRCSCGNVNYARRIKCNRCNLDKPSGMEISSEGAGWTPPIDHMMFGPEWQCSSCGNMNFAARLKCNRCQMDRGPMGMGFSEGVRMGISPMPLQVQQPSPAIENGGPHPNMMILRDSEDWTCSKCSNVNLKQQAQCTGCGSGKEKYPIKRKLSELMSQGWICHSCSNVNWAHRMKCNKCGIDKGESNDHVFPKKKRLFETNANA